MNKTKKQTIKISKGLTAVRRGSTYNYNGTNYRVDSYDSFTGDLILGMMILDGQDRSYHSDSKSVELEAPESSNHYSHDSSSSHSYDSSDSSSSSDSGGSDGGGGGD